MKKSWTRLIAIGLLSLAVVAAGCSSQSTQQPADNQPTSQTPAPTTSNDGPKTLIFARGGDAVSLDPIQTTDGESARVTINIYETLVKYAETSTNIEPALAESWTVADDGKTYTFKLRQGVKFHDGTDFNADAVVYNFERWMDRDHPYHVADTFLYYGDMFGGFKGDDGHVIDSVTALDPYTVEFKLKTPLAPFLQNLGMYCFGIASPAAIEQYKDKFGENPVGTGPFKFESWDRNDKITLVKNPDYWNTGYPKLDRVVIKVIPDNSARLTAMQSGEIDIMSGLNPEDVSTVEANDELQIFLRPGMNIGFLGFNVEREPFTNPKVRQALSHAVNKQAIIDAFFSGLAIKAVNPLPPTLWGHNDDIVDREYDIEKAKQLLAEAGYPDGFKTTLWAMPVARDYMPDAQKVAEVLQQEFAKINVQAEIVTYEWPTYLEKTKNGEQDMFFLGWTGDNGDPDNFLYVLLDKNNIDANNRVRYANEEVHQLLLQAQVEPNQDKRAELYKRAQEIIFEDAPMVPLVHSQSPVVGKANIVNYVPHPTGSESLEKVDYQ